MILLLLTNTTSAYWAATINIQIKKNNTAKSVLHGAVCRIYQGVRYFQNVTVSRCHYKLQLSL
jgi:hypothetical protein